MSKKIYSLLKYQLFRYSSSPKTVMPWVGLLIFFYLLYGISPLYVLDSLFASCMFSALTALWIGHSLNSLLAETEEQLLILRTNSAAAYYLSGLLLTLLLSFMLSLLGTAAPLLLNILNSGTLFRRPLTGHDLLQGFLLHLGSTCSAFALGGLCHPRLTRDRRLSIALTFLAAVLLLSKTNIATAYPAAKFGLWLLPPVADFAAWYSHDLFSWQTTGQLFLLLLGLTFLFSWLKVHLLIKRKF